LTARTTCVAIVPARRAEATLERTLESLRLQDPIARILVVTSADDPTAEVARRCVEVDPRIEVVAGPAALSAGAARNVGRDHAGDADFLLFIDADCSLDAGGVAALQRELCGRGLASISARVVCDGNGVVARARHLLEFKEAEGRHAAPPAWLPPSTTMLCRAEVFDRAGGFPDMWPGEDLVLMHRLQRLGCRVGLSARVRTHHRHPAGFAEMLAHQHRLGLTSAAARRMTSVSGAVFVRYRWLAPLLLPARLLRIAAWQLRSGFSGVVALTQLSPVLLLGLVWWTAGFVRGARDAEACVGERLELLR